MHVLRHKRGQHLEPSSDDGEGSPSSTVDVSLRLILDSSIRMRGVRPDGALRGKVLVTTQEDGIWCYGISVLLLGAEVAFDGFHAEDHSDWKDKTFLRLPFRIWPTSKASGDELVDGALVFSNDGGGGGGERIVHGGGDGLDHTMHDGLDFLAEEDRSTWDPEDGWILPGSSPQLGSSSECTGPLATRDASPSSPPTRNAVDDDDEDGRVGDIHKEDGESLSASRRTVVALMSNDVRLGIGSVTSTGDVLARAQVAQTAGGSSGGPEGSRRSVTPVRSSQALHSTTGPSSSSVAYGDIRHGGDDDVDLDSGGGGGGTSSSSSKARFLPALRTYSFPFEIQVPGHLQPSINRSEYVSMEYAVQAFLEPAVAPCNRLPHHTGEDERSLVMKVKHVSPMYPLTVYGISDAHREMLGSSSVRHAPAKASSRTPKLDVEAHLHTGQLCMGAVAHVVVEITNRTSKSVKLTSARLVQRVVLTRQVPRRRQKPRDGFAPSPSSSSSSSSRKGLDEHAGGSGVDGGSAGLRREVSKIVLVKHRFGADQASVPPDSCIKKHVRLRIPKPAELVGMKVSSQPSHRVMPSVVANLFVLSHHVVVKVARSRASKVVVTVPVCLWDPSMERDGRMASGEPRILVTVPSHLDRTDPDGDVYTVYCMHVKTPAEEWEMRHRYSAFHALHKDLQKAFKQQRLPKLPPKRFWPKPDPTFVQRRRISLEDYVNNLLMLKHVRECKPMRSFLGYDNAQQGGGRIVISADDT